MEITCVSVGKVSNPWLRQGIDIFESRISKYIKFSSVIVPDLKNSKNLSKESIKEEEGKAILNLLNSSDYVVLLDEKGKEFTSKEFAFWIQKQMNTGKKRILLVIGGPFGFSETVYFRADFKIALSKMTFPHEMAKLILTEQIYRCMTILKGEPYHHD